jgi:hypothetical protein
MQAGLNPSSSAGSLAEIVNDAAEKLQFGKKLDEAQTQFENDSKRIKDGLSPETTPKPQPAPQLKSNAFPRTLPLFKLAQADTAAQAALGALTDAQRAEFFKKFSISGNDEQVSSAIFRDKSSGQARSIVTTPANFVVSGQKIPEGSILVTLHSNQNLKGSVNSFLFSKGGKLMGRVKDIPFDKIFSNSAIVGNLSNSSLKFEPKSEKDAELGDIRVAQIKQQIDSGKLIVKTHSLPIPQSEK